MKKWNRRELLRDSLLGLTTIGAGVFALEDALAPTPAHGELGEYGEFLLARGESPDAPPRSFDPTDADAWGPFYKQGAPFRGRVAPEDAPGTPMLIRGRVYGREARKALDGAVIDVWQADAGGRYHGMDEGAGRLLPLRDGSPGALRLRLLAAALAHPFLRSPPRLPAPRNAAVFRGRPEAERTRTLEALADHSAAAGFPWEKIRDGTLQHRPDEGVRNIPGVAERAGEAPPALTPPVRNPAAASCPRAPTARRTT